MHSRIKEKDVMITEYHSAHLLYCHQIKVKLLCFSAYKRLVHQQISVSIVFGNIYWSTDYSDMHELSGISMHMTTKDTKDKNIRFNF